MSFNDKDRREPARQLHPASLAARAVRALRSAHRLRGWLPLGERIVPHSSELTFRVRNDGLWFEGDLASFIERRIYLYGGYDRSAIRQFVALVPPDRRRVALDVGTNVGTHGLAFARSFAEVHCFEPNPAVFARLARNAALNAMPHLHLHPVGLGDVSAELDFHSISDEADALGTFSPVQQYDCEVRVIGKGLVERADDYLEGRLGGPVDAVKLDVQGFEPEALRGMQRILERDRPYLWIEVSDLTLATFDSAAALRRTIPYDFRLLRFDTRPAGPLHRSRLVAEEGDRLRPADYVAIPA